jgi:hypothetical protein
LTEYRRQLDGVFSLTEGKDEADLDRISQEGDVTTRFMQAWGIQNHACRDRMKMMGFKDKQRTRRKGRSVVGWKLDGKWVVLTSTS